MATGDIGDMTWRMFAVLPQRWFPALESAPVLQGVLSGIGQAWSFCFNLITYARQQSRIATATGSFLDMVATDFFGTDIRRRVQESDASFLGRITANLLSEKATRAGVCSAVAELTAAAVTVFEPGRPADTGGYGSSSLPSSGGGLGYGMIGLAYGSLNLPFQFLLKVNRPAATGNLLQVSGYAELSEPGTLRASGGYGVGALEYLGSSLIGSSASDDDIRTAILAAIPVNTVAWLALI